MNTTRQADDTFLRRILFTLVICATFTGAIAAYTAVSAAQTGLVHLAMPAGL